jgi:transcriptional regulator NrdR family protein
MIVCPRCGSDTAVSETRGHKRRRVCKDYSCNARLTTYEIPADDLAMIRRLAGDAEGVNE